MKYYHKHDGIVVKRNGTDHSTTVKLEVGKQIEVFLSNAATRLKRKKNKN